MKKQNLTIENIESLFPGSSLTIGNQSVIIQPLNIEQLAHLLKKVSGLGEILAGKEITLENFNTPEKLFQLAVIVLDNVPEVLQPVAPSSAE